MRSTHLIPHLNSLLNGTLTPPAYSLACGKARDKAYESPEGAASESIESIESSESNPSNNSIPSIPSSTSTPGSRGEYHAPSLHRCGKRDACPTCAGALPRGLLTGSSTTGGDSGLAEDEEERRRRAARASGEGEDERGTTNHKSKITNLKSFPYSSSSTSRMLSAAVAPEELTILLSPPLPLSLPPLSPPFADSACVEEASSMPRW